MALSGSVTTGESYGRSVTLNWSATQSIANNTSTVSWNVKGSGSASGYVIVAEIRVKINGTQVFYRNTGTRTKCYQGTQLCSGSINIPHSADGRKTFTASVEAGIYQWAINKSGSKNFTLNTIPRASTITWGSGTSGTAGVTNGTNIDIHRASSSFTHTITYSFGNATGTVCTKTTATNVKWTIPMSLLNQIPNSTSGSGTMTCYTYSGNTHIGTSTLGLGIGAPASVKPSIISSSIQLNNDANATIKGWGVAVAGFTKIKVNAAASGSYSSTIKSFTISEGYSTTQNGTSLGYTGGTLSSGKKTFYVTTTDSRGRASDRVTAGEVDVYAYNKPSLTLFNVWRSSSNAKKMVVRTSWSYSPVGSRNAVTATLYYKRATDSGWTTYGSISQNTDVALTGDFSETHSYNFRIVIRDSVGNSAEAQSFVSTIAVLMDFRAGGKGLGIGKIAETDAMEVALDSVFYGDVYIMVNNTKMSLRDYIRQAVS